MTETFLEERILALGEQDREGWLALLVERAHEALLCGRFNEARLCVREMERCGGSAAIPRTAIAGAIAVIQGDHPAASNLLWQAMAHARASGDVRLEARA